jgi:hypothetical protein
MAMTVLFFASLAFVPLLRRGRVYAGLAETEF